MSERLLFKDVVMANLTLRGVNVASFVSFDPNGKQRFCRIKGVDSHYIFENYQAAVEAFYGSGNVDNINIRTFLPEKPDGNPFFLGKQMGFENPAIAAECIKSHVEKGYYVIVNENSIHLTAVFPA